MAGAAAGHRPAQRPHFTDRSQETSPADHEAMTEAVADGDPDLAASLMEAHLATVEIQLLQNMHAAQSKDVRG
ncbi:FCD domain-containing protein [Streptomyces sp. NPDC058175]